MGLSALKPFLLSKGALRSLALAPALLALGGSLPVAAGWPSSQPQPAQRVQFRPDPYGRYQQDPYEQDQYRPDQYRPDPRRYGDQRDGYRPDSAGPGRRGYDDRGDRYGQGGGGRGGSYQRSCEDVRQDGPILSAVCGDGRGHRFESSIDVNRCGRSDIGNSRGILQCGNIRGNGRRVD